jgi:hypothetical protein
MVQIKYPGRQQLWSNSTQESNPSAHSIVSFMENAKAGLQIRRWHLLSL